MMLLETIMLIKFISFQGQKKYIRLIITYILYKSMSKTKNIENKIISNIIPMSNLMMLKNLLPLDLIYEVNKYIQPSHKQVMEQLTNKVKVLNRSYKIHDNNDFAIRFDLSVKSYIPNGKSYTIHIIPVIKTLKWCMNKGNIYRNKLDYLCSINNIKYNSRTTKKQKVKMLLAL